MFVSSAESDQLYEKMVDKGNLVGITLSPKGYFQCWKEVRLEFCNYVLYDCGELLYRKGSTFLASNAAMNKSKLIDFSGRHTLLTENSNGEHLYFGKKHPLTDDYSLVTAFRHGEKIILIIADALFSKQPEYFEFPATSSAERLCLAMVHQVISLRDKPTGDRLKLWLRGVRHPLGKLQRGNPSDKTMKEPSVESCLEENATVHCQDTQQEEIPAEQSAPLYLKEEQT